MKTRLQLIRGYINGTLTEEEKKVVEQNTLIMESVLSVASLTNTTKQGRKKRGRS